MVLTTCCMLLCWAVADGPAGDATGPEQVRIATFNIWELSRVKLDVVDDRGAGANRQLQNAAEIVQRVRPDILLINEIDFDVTTKQNAALFRDRYLRVSQNGQKPIDYPHIYFEATNTGVPSGMDLDNDGMPDGPADAWGFGKYPGQYGMALLSKYPLDVAYARTFQMLKWKAMPGNLMPDGTNDKPNWYSPEEAAKFRLSSKSHWDIPVRLGKQVIHLLCSHPTPPVFDGKEDRNGRRNFDEIRFWADYLTGGKKASYITDDNGKQGALPADASFVIMGDLNAEPVRNSALYGIAAVGQLLKHPRVNDTKPTSKGGPGSNKPGPPKYSEQKTSGFGRIDYVLPSRDLNVTSSGVYWPTSDDPANALVARQQSSSDHRLVWIDVVIPKKQR